MGEPEKKYGDERRSGRWTSSSSLSDETEELQRLENAPPFWRNKSSSKKRLSKQLSMCELPRNIAWERRRRQFLEQERRRNGINEELGEGEEEDVLTDDDLHELRGCIELGFGFNEENGLRLCPTIPALDLYFAVNRQFVTSPLSSPTSTSTAATSPSLPPPAAIRGRSASFGSDLDAWRICSQGNPIYLPLLCLIYLR